MIICLLGRQPEISLAELEALYPNRVTALGKDTALVEADPAQFDIQRLGGTQKAGRIVTEYATSDWRAVSKNVEKHYATQLRGGEHKITFGISTYGFRAVRSQDLTALGLSIKSAVKQSGGSLRLIPSKDASLSTAVSHHNKLGLSPHKIELMIIKSGGKTYLAESLGAQNITAYAKRDQGRPARDAFVGMLPPKLAQIMLNLALGQTNSVQSILDPFCGTGVVLQEALLQGHTVYGSDLNPKMVDYTRRNLTWLSDTHAQYPLGSIQAIREGDAMNYIWAEAPSLDAVVCETYLGQPFSATPSPSKLREVRGNCNHIIGAFLSNISQQVRPGTKFCVAVPAWRNLKDNTITRLPLATSIREKEGFKLINSRPLLYFREDQVVARDILILEKI